jgi:hypothetical protein
MRYLHLNPSATKSDPLFAAAVAHASAIAETSNPELAMRAAFQAAGVETLEERYDVLLGELDAMKARLSSAQEALAGTGQFGPRPEPSLVADAPNYAAPAAA